MPKRWYVVKAKSGSEKTAARNIEESIRESNIKDQFGKVLVPTEEVVEMSAGQKKRSERKFFPGYVFVQMELSDDSWHLIKGTSKVMGFIGGKADEPAPIADKEAELILQRIDDSIEKPKPKTIFEPGEMVRVADGPFNDFNGVVEEVSSNRI